MYIHIHNYTSSKYFLTNVVNTTLILEVRRILICPSVRRAFTWKLVFKTGNKYLNVYMSRMQYAPHDSNHESSLTPSHLHMPSVKNRDLFSKTKAFCFVILDKLDTPNAYLFPYQVLCVMHLWGTDFRVITEGRRTPIQHFFTGFHLRFHV